MKQEDLLNEFQNIATAITEKYIFDYTKSTLNSNEYINLIAPKFQKELAEKGTEIIHQSIIKSVGDSTDLLSGIQKINLESVIKLKKTITNS